MKRADAPVVGQPHKTRQLRRHRDERRDGLAVALARQRQRDREAEIGNERKRMRRIDGERRQNRKYLLVELGIEPDAIGIGQFFAVTTEMPASRNSTRNAAQMFCWSAINVPATCSILAICWAGVRPSSLTEATPAATMPFKPATRTM